MAAHAVIIHAEENPAATSPAAVMCPADAITVAGITADATTVDAITVAGTTVDATTVDAITVTGTTVDAMTAGAMTAGATTVDATTVDATTVDATPVAAYFGWGTGFAKLKAVIACNRISYRNVCYCYCRLCIKNGPRLISRVIYHGDFFGADCFFTFRLLFWLSRVRGVCPLLLTNRACLLST